MTDRKNAASAGAMEHHAQVALSARHAYKLSYASAQQDIKARPSQGNSKSVQGPTTTLNESKQGTSRQKQ